MKKPAIWTGALVGALLTTALIAVLFFARQVAGLPFVPFDVFDWVTRTLPGAMVTFGIDTMVGLIRGLNLGETSTVAKLAEQIMAVAGLWITGIIAGALLFGWMRWRDTRPWYLSGLVLGAAIAVPVLLIRSQLAQAAPAGPVISTLWILFAFTAWGVAVAWVYHRLSLRPDSSAAHAERIDRRSFLVRLGGATAAITVVGAGVGAWAAARREDARQAALGEPWSALNPLPNADAAVQPVPGTRREFTPVEDHYRIDINTRPPTLDEAQWRLRIGGLVEQPLELTLEQLRGYEALDQFITLECISNPVAGDLISTQRWTGVSLQRLLPDFGLRGSATHLLIRSADGFFETVALDAIRSDPRIMLTYAWDGLPLPPGHGFPLRIYIPDHFGMKQPKWIESIEAVDQWEPGYWVQRGWDREARIQTTAVIDSVSSNMMIGQGDGGIVPIGGIAFAGARGISSVEVRVDDGAWEQAQLREPLSEKSWVLWRYEWPFAPGEHTFTVRCTDGSGTPQIPEMTPIRPDGATGLHSTRVML